MVHLGLELVIQLIYHAYNPLTLSNNMKYYIRQQRQLNDPIGESKQYSDVLTLEELIPWYKNFTGDN